MLGVELTSVEGFDEPKVLELELDPSLGALGVGPEEAAGLQPLQYDGERLAGAVDEVPAARVLDQGVAPAEHGRQHATLVLADRALHTHGTSACACAVVRLRVHVKLGEREYKEGGEVLASDVELEHLIRDLVPLAHHLQKPQAVKGKEGRGGECSATGFSVKFLYALMREEMRLME
jgi:hypothetical protein